MSGWAVLIVILAVLTVGLLSVPLTFKAGGCLRPEEKLLEARIAWGWGVIATTIELKRRKPSFGLRLAGITVPVFRKKSGVAKAKNIRKKVERKKERSEFNLSTVFMVLNRKLLTVFLGYIKRLFRSLRLRLHLSGVYGTDDPALTGMIAALFAALRAEHINFDLNADFREPVLDVAGETSGRIVPIEILWLTLCFLMAEPVRKFWWAQFKTKFIRIKQKEDAQYV